jgi:hypothetical protein
VDHDHHVAQHGRHYGSKLWTTVNTATGGGISTGA